ncbi:MAG: STAS domain-containing protein [Chloroflexota bacterium]
MKIDFEKGPNNRAVLRPRGQVDADTTPELKRLLKQLVDEGVRVLVVDLDRVDFIDSSGLSALVSGLKSVRQRGGSLNLCRVHPQALTALRLTMLDRVFSIYPSVEEALDPGKPPSA